MYVSSRKGGKSALLYWQSRVKTVGLFRGQKVLTQPKWNQINAVCIFNNEETLSKNYRGPCCEIQKKNWFINFFCKRGEGMGSTIIVSLAEVKNYAFPIHKTIICAATKCFSEVEPTSKG